MAPTQREEPFAGFPPFTNVAGVHAFPRPQTEGGAEPTTSSEFLRFLGRQTLWRATSSVENQGALQCPTHPLEPYMAELCHIRLPFAAKWLFRTPLKLTLRFMYLLG